MATNTDIENSLIAKISDVKLRTSLALIRESVNSIWADDAPRIIKGFTDHGFNHCLRLIKYASELLEANKGKALSDEEMYLLIAAIYLHDIGMQCDVVEFPEIKKKAEEYGAKFNINFTSVEADKYTLKEQIEIRKNHHLISAGWIAHAFTTSETILATSIKTIPDDLMSDLIEVCKFHSSLDISTCKQYFEINSQGRKQLIASLVRFADELDVDKSRVSIQTVLNFSIEPNHAYYWWLHHLTNINITDNILTLKVRLNPEDFSKYGTYINETYIDNFEKKNKSVLDILKNNSIPISISKESKVVSYDFAPKLPDEIVKVIQEMQGKTNDVSNINKDIIKQEQKNSLNNFPVPKPYFAGRKSELTDLKQAFETNSFIFIEGGGGIGKTQFVAKFIEEQKLNSKIVWYECIPTSQPDDIINGAGFEELLKGKEKTDREKFSAFKDKIEENDLVVFLDNYQEVENIPVFKSFLGFINEYLNKGHIIVIGRDNIVTPNLQPKRVPITGLGDDSLTHAQQLIKQSYQNLIDTPVEKLKAICNTLRGYPLAIDLAIYLLSLEVSIDNILTVAVSEAQEEGSDIENISKRLLNEIFTRHDALEEEKEFLKLFSIFRGKIHKDEALSVISPDVFEKANRKLINRNLLEFNNDYLELHPLIREFCYNELKNKKEIHQKASKFYIDKRTNKWNPELEEKIFYHLSCSEQWKDISDNIIKFGRDIILQGFLDRLQHMITLVKQKNIIEPIFDIFEGDIAEMKGNWDESLESFNKAKKCAAKEVSIEGLIKYGEILYRKGDVKEAKPLFEEAVKITEKDNHKKWYARALNDLGIVNEFSGNLVDALNLFDQAFLIRQYLDNKEDIASTLNNIASIKATLGDNSKALELNEKSLEIRNEIGDKAGIGMSLNNISVIKINLGLYDDALQLLEKSLKLHEEIGYMSCIASNLNSLGYIKMKQGKKTECFELYNSSLKIREEIEDKAGIAGSLINIAAFKESIGKEKEALLIYEKSLILLKEIENKSAIAICLNNIGSIKKKLGFKREALDLYNNSLSIRKEIGDKSGIANSLNNIGILLLETSKEFDIACLYLLKASALYEQIGIPNQNSHMNLASMKKELGYLKFKEKVFNAFQQLDEELKRFINMNEILGEPIIAEKKQGRNEPCNCGSGKKYKNCHGKGN